jgi:hypothetical protein
MLDSFIEARSCSATLREGHLWASRDPPDFSVWPVDSIVAQNICAWNIVVLRFRKHCLWFLVTTLMWMDLIIVCCKRGHEPLTNGSSATSGRLQITSNAALLHFPEFKFRRNKPNLFMFYATEYRGWWMWLQHFERAKNFTFCTPGMMFGEMPSKTYFALQVNRHSSLPTDLNQTDNVN